MINKATETTSHVEKKAFSSEDVEHPHDYISSEERETRRNIALLMIVGVLLMTLAMLMGWPFA